MNSSADIQLPVLLGASLPAADRAEVARWFSNAAPLRIEPEVFRPLLDRWKASVPDRASDRAPLIRVLERAARPGASLTFNAVARERHGGRRCLYFVHGYRGPLILSQRGAGALLRQARTDPGDTAGIAHLQAIPNAVRAAIHAPVGHVFLDVDIASCFPAIAAAVSGDAQLGADLGADVHQVIGDLLAPRLPPARRRRLGKTVNACMLGGQTPIGLRAELVAAGLPALAPLADQLHATWWARYPALASFVAQVNGLVLGRSRQGEPVRIQALDGREFQFAPAEVSGFARSRMLNPGAGDLAAAQRSILSSLWRSVEGSVLDRALQRLEPHKSGVGLRLSLTMYDGALFVAPGDLAAEAAERVTACFGQALVEAGIPAGLTLQQHPTWGMEK